MTGPNFKYQKIIHEYNATPKRRRPLAWETPFAIHLKFIRIIFYTAYKITSMVTKKRQKRIYK